ETRCAPYWPCPAVRIKGAEPRGVYSKGVPQPSDSLRGTFHRISPLCRSNAAMYESVSWSASKTIKSPAMIGEAPKPIELVNGPSGTFHLNLPDSSYEMRPKSLKNTYTFSPSVTGVMAAGLFS